MSRSLVTFKNKIFNFRLPFVAHERLCLSSLIERLRDREVKVTGSSFAIIIGVG